MIATDPFVPTLVRKKVIQAVLQDSASVKVTEVTRRLLGERERAAQSGRVLWCRCGAVCACGRARVCVCGSVHGLGTQAVHETSLLSSAQAAHHHLISVHAAERGEYSTHRSQGKACITKTDNFSA